MSRTVCGGTFFGGEIEPGVFHLVLDQFPLVALPEEDQPPKVDPNTTEVDDVPDAA